MRIVEVESENDESGSDEASDDDEDDDGGMESESEDKDEGAGANNGPIIYNCIEYDSDNDDDYPLDKIHMVNARRIPHYERHFEPDAVEEVFETFPFIKENPGVWFRTVPHCVFSYDEDKDELRVMARPPLGMFNLD